MMKNILVLAGGGDNDECAETFGETGIAANAFKAGLSGVIDHTLPNPAEPGDKSAASGLPPMVSPRAVTKLAGRATRRPNS